MTSLALFAWLLAMIAPYLGDDELRFYHECETIYLDMLSDSG